MNKETITLINPNLYSLCLDAQELIQKGYIFSEGYPHQLSWQYHAVLERNVPETVAPEQPPRQVGRPKGPAK